MPGRRRVPHVAVLIETSRAWGRGALRGVKRYINEHGPWSVYAERRDLESPVPPWLHRWRGDGILTRTGTPEMLKVLQKTGVPVVEMRTTIGLGNTFPVVRTNDRAIGQMAARHLLECGFQQFGCYTLDNPHLDQFALRCAGFVAEVAAAGRRCRIYREMVREENPNDWEKQQRSLTRWVSGLPKPAGVLGTTDQLGFWLLDACGRSGVAVPEELAVIGVEDDELLCSLTTPPLSSVRINTERVGYEAAALLDRIMRGKKKPAEPLCIDPVGVTQRRSTDVLAITDRPVAAVLRLIRERASEGLTLPEVLKTAHMSRSTLERRMRLAIGRSPMAEMRRVQFERVKTLLTDTDLSLAAIAERAGFAYAQYLSRAFKSAFGQTPGDFRASARGRAGKDTPRNP